jgi:hypothetical protein
MATLVKRMVSRVRGKIATLRAVAATNEFFHNDNAPLLGIPRESVRLGGARTTFGNVRIAPW